MSRNVKQQDSGISLIPNFFEDYKGLFIGENHSNSAPKKFLIRNMQALKDKGFGILFLEHIPADYQERIDRYYKTGEMPKTLRKWLLKQNEGHGVESEYNFLTLVQAAKEAGIKVVALEKDKDSYRRINGGRPRTIFFNAYAEKNIRDELKKWPDEGRNIKWLSLVGITHIYHRFDVKGLSELFPESIDLAILDSKYFDEEFYRFAEEKYNVGTESEFSCRNLVSINPEKELKVEGFTQTCIHLGARRSTAHDLPFVVDGSDEDDLPSPPKLKKDSAASVAGANAAEKYRMPTIKEAEHILSGFPSNKKLRGAKSDSSSPSADDEVEELADQLDESFKSEDFRTPENPLGNQSPEVGSAAASAKNSPPLTSPKPASPNDDSSISNSAKSGDSTGSGKLSPVMSGKGHSV